MKRLYRCLAVPIFLLGIAGTGTARAVTLHVVFDNTASVSGGVFGPGCCQAGNEISLGGDARKIVQLSWRIDSQSTDVVTGIDARIYANDGPDGAPETLLWESGPLTGIPVSATDRFLDVAVPRITVPDTVTVTSRILDTTPVALGRSYGGPPSVGSVDASWLETESGEWHRYFGPWGMRILAVPEPPTLALMIVPAVLLVRPRRGRSASNASGAWRDRDRQAPAD